MATSIVSLLYENIEKTGRNNSRELLALAPWFKYRRGFLSPTVLGWPAYRNASLVFVVLSVITNLVIAAYDGYLAQFGGGTLSTLYGVAVVFIVLALLLFARPSLGFKATLILSFLWFLGQIGNALSSGPRSASFPHGFTAYILGYGPVAANNCPYLCPPFVYSALVSILLQIPLSVFAFLGWRSFRRMSAKASDHPTAQ